MESTSPVSSYYGMYVYFLLYCSSAGGTVFYRSLLIELMNHAGNVMGRGK